MKIDILTLFPDMYTGPFSEAIIKKEKKKNIVEINIHNFRDYTLDPHGNVDDTPFGGGSGMVLTCQPIFDAINDLVKMTQQLGKQAVIAYKPIVDDVCSRDASEKEVAWLLDYMLDFLGNDQMLEFFKQVCRKYLEKYPDEIRFHIMEYYKLYEPEKLVGTEYEYLLDEMNLDD